MSKFDFRKFGSELLGHICPNLILGYLVVTIWDIYVFLCLVGFTGLNKHVLYCVRFDYIDGLVTVKFNSPPQ